MAGIEITDTKTLSDKKYKLEEVSFKRTNSKGKEISQKREVYRRGASTSILLYDESRKTVLFTKQFRLPVYLRQHNDGTLIEACAGLIDEGELPEQTIIREVEEETGYRISEIRKIYEAYLSPASLTELMHFYVGRYSPDLNVSAGGGLENEGEDVETLELTFEDAKKALESGKINDAKTIILLQYAMLQGIIAI
ncbi:NUDIX domain-containing protein [Pedobacter sp. HMF7647]|uniref:GDP-mannose pyrophosphatase n=1 Tax=Hufsiella arboris TaxID=2695275 RepID=A0A7K1YDV8_9SPHI|nr:NUDIX domain-containing protein [Hufsiella arboris]MXV52786.1 NUDIX domain-containing protein [Hufsiella arboris]